MSTMTGSEIIDAINALPELPTVYAKDMLHSQAFRVDAATRSAIKARADFFASVGMPRTVRLEVRDLNGVRIGELRYENA